RGWAGDGGRQARGEPSRRGRRSAVAPPGAGRQRAPARSEPMKRFFWRREGGVDSKAERKRADRLEDALSAWQQGDVADVVDIDRDPDMSQPLGDELAAAQQLAAYADATPPAHEALVALRAALAAREAD